MEEAMLWEATQIQATELCTLAWGIHTAHVEEGGHQVIGTQLL